MTSLSQLITPVPAAKYYELLEYYGVFTLSYLRPLYLDAGFGADADNIETAIKEADYFTADLSIYSLDDFRRDEWLRLAQEGKPFGERYRICSDEHQLHLCEQVIAWLCKE